MRRHRGRSSTLPLVHSELVCMRSLRLFSTRLDRRRAAASRIREKHRLLFESLECRTLLAGDVWTQRGSDSGHTSYLDISVAPDSFVPAWTKPLTYANSGSG